MDDCVFCKIVKRELSSQIEAENENVIAFKSIEPVAETHILIVPKKHIPTVLDIQSEDKDLFFEMVSMVQDLVNKKNLTDGYKLVFNGGKYQAVPHLHWHLLAGDLGPEAESKI